MKYLKERNTEYNRRHTAQRKAELDDLKARAEVGEWETQTELKEYKQYQIRASVKCYRKMREAALNGDPVAKERYEWVLAQRRAA